MKEFLADLTPEEVTERLSKGERVYYEDSKGNFYSYRFINGICVRFDSDGEPDGYGRSIYSTCGAYFNSDVKEEEHISPEGEKLKEYLKIIVKALKEV